MSISKILFSLCFLVLICSACKKNKAEKDIISQSDITTIANSDEKEDWKELQCGLWINRKGDIAHKSLAVAFRENDDDLTDVVDYYIYKTYNELDSLNNYETNLKDIVDTLTFSKVTDHCFKDKNHVYMFRPMAYGGNLSVNYSIDLKTFAALDGSDAYTCDKNRCFIYGREIENADRKSFRVLMNEGVPVARDKNHIYMWGDKMSDNDIAEYKKENKIDLRQL